MNNYIGEVRNRSQNLLIVEGDHEKNDLFWLIFRCFPELHISLDDIWIYGTNIYKLYDDIVKEYGANWIEDDIDLPYVISKKLHPDALRYKEDFVNIILIFDYERHDTYFSESKILNMQEYFVDAADTGKLYINYPMIESYQHLKALPDTDYAERKIPVSLKPGPKYKSLVKTETIIEKSVDYPHRLNDLLNEHFGITDEQIRKQCVDSILAISDEVGLNTKMSEILEDKIEDALSQTAKYQLIDWVSKSGYACNKQTYWQYMRNLFQQIILHNICKANLLQTGIYQIEPNQYKSHFEQIDLTEILKIQNTYSSDPQNGFIWVLNTCVFFIAEYNFTLILE